MNNPAFKMPRRPLAALALASCLLAPAAHAADGDLDPTFGTNGQTVSPRPNTDVLHSQDANAVALQKDGKIIAAGSETYQVGPVLHQDFCLARYKTDGSVDTTFGTGGWVTTSFFDTDQFETINGLAVQPDGKILAGGTTYNGIRQCFALARYNTDGSLDSGFGTNGKVVTPVGSHDATARALVLQGNGKIVLGGSASEDKGGTDYALARYTRDGVLDTTYGNGGVVLASLEDSTDEIYAMAAQADGKIVACGKSRIIPKVVLSAARFNLNGSLDKSFGGTGHLLVPFDGFTSFPPTALAIQGNGKIILAGSANYKSRADFFALARILPNGTLDPEFGLHGTTLGAFKALGNVTYTLALQKAGKIVVGGTEGVNSGMGRLDLDGSVDENFGEQGGASYRIGSGKSEFHAVAIQGDDKIVTAGHAFTPQNQETFAITRHDGGNGAPTTYVQDFSPKAASIGDSMDVFGTNFSQATTVQIGANNINQTFTIVDDTHIHIAALAPGTEHGRVHVWSNDRIAASGDIFHIIPKITGFTPASGPVGAIVTISGSGFRMGDDSNVTAIRFTGLNGTLITARHFSVQSKTQLTVQVPLGAKSGPIQLENAYGSTRSTDSFTVTAGAAAEMGPSGKSS